MYWGSCTEKLELLQQSRPYDLISNAVLDAATGWLVVRMVTVGPVRRGSSAGSKTCSNAWIQFIASCVAYLNGRRRAAATPAPQLEW